MEFTEVNGSTNITWNRGLSNLAGAIPVVHTYILSRGHHHSLLHCLPLRPIVHFLFSLTKVVEAEAGSNYFARSLLMEIWSSTCQCRFKASFQYWYSFNTGFSRGVFYPFSYYLACAGSGNVTWAVRTHTQSPPASSCELCYTQPLLHSAGSSCLASPNTLLAGNHCHLRVQLHHGCLLFFLLFVFLQFNSPSKQPSSFPSSNLSLMEDW